MRLFQTNQSGFYQEFQFTHVSNRADIGNITLITMERIIRILKQYVEEEIWNRVRETIHPYIWFAEHDANTF